MSLLETVRTQLASVGVVNTSWPCYIGYMPDDGSNTAISLQWTGGIPQDTLGDENLRETFQVKIRGAFLGHAACEAKWRAMYAALHSQETALGVSFIMAITSGPLAWTDGKNRTCMSCNFLVHRPRV
jgi:hypothetical protein